MNSESTTFSTSKGGHSAVVKMRLDVNGFSLPVTQMGPDYVLVQHPVNHPPGLGTLILRVDQTERQWPVNLPEGISASQQRITIQPA